LNKEAPVATHDPESELLTIPLEKIRRNPENPRINFRTEELDELTESIRRYGVQVPISVYREGKEYVLIDGERRWRCSLKLNRSTIPALIQPKPDPLKNLLLMFNIHALREQWDLLTIAMKLPTIIKLLQKQAGGKKPTERAVRAFGNNERLACGQLVSTAGPRPPLGVRL
jgi:ParB/RepB/Spo0J family partition protein